MDDKIGAALSSLASGLATAALVILPVALTTVPFLVVAALPLETGVRDIRPTAGRGLPEKQTSSDPKRRYVARYHMDAGTLRLDLRGWRPRHEVKGPVCIDASVGLGRIVVIVPRAKRALIDVERAHVNAGSVTLYGQRSHGGQVDVAKVDRNFVLTPEQRNCASSQSKPPTTIANRKARLRLRLRLDAALGTIEVHRGQLPENTAQAVTTGT